MSSSAPAASPAEAVHKLSERAQAQRQRIIGAAAKCFSASGFHAASIADIAAAADMSQGLIYRYFENKNAIVQAIITSCLQKEPSKAIKQLESPEDVLRAYMGALEHWRREDDAIMSAVLMLEMTVECTRDDRIAKAARLVNNHVRKHLQEVLRRCARQRGLSLSASALRGRTMILQCLFEGLAVRSIREPDLDRAALRSALREVITTLMTG